MYDDGDEKILVRDKYLRWKGIHYILNILFLNESLSSGDVGFKFRIFKRVMVST